MSEKEFNMTNNTENTKGYDEYTDISSSSTGSVNQYTSQVNDTVYAPPVYADKKTDSMADTMPIGSYDYNSYASQFSAPVYSTRTASPKKTGKGSKTALIAGTLALALVLGVGGGALGSYLMYSASADSTQTVSSQSGKSAKATTSDGSDSGLTIIEAANTEKSSSTIEEVVARVKDSVVEITTETTTYDNFFGQYVTQGAGSGVIISADGYIVTNNHVIDGASSIEVTLTDGKTYKAKLVGTDATFDVALIKIDAKDLTVATFGSSADLKLGETSIVIGNPLGQLGGTVTHGIISALNRSIEIEGKTMELLQTDAAINPGNSGGAMFDADGNLIGIVVAKSTQSSSGTSLEGLGFAIPIDNVKSILGDLKENGRVTGRAALGISVVDVLTDNAKARYGVEKTGVYVYSLNDGGAAEKAGLKVGDCIVRLGDREITEKSVLTSTLLKYKAGDTVDVVVYRDGEEKTISVKLDESNQEKNASNENNSNNFNPGGSTDNNGRNRGNDDDFGDIYDYYFGNGGF